MDTVKPTGADIAFTHIEAMIADRILLHSIYNGNISLAEKRIQELETIKTALYDCIATYPTGLRKRVWDDLDKAISHLNNCIHEINGG